MPKELNNLINDQNLQWLLQFVQPAATVLLLVAITLATAWLSRRYIVPLLEQAVKRTKIWDDILINHGFFKRFGQLLPVIILYTAADILFSPQSQIAELIKRGALVLLVLTGIRLVDALLLSVGDIYNSFELATGRPVKSYLGAGRIVLYILAGIFIIAVLTGQSPWGIFSVLGGLTAVLLLVFKDTILGFVANLQLTGHDMVRVGDWIEMPKFGADGDVIDVSIHTIKVQNWDKTITTIPTYALVSDAFKNWRGMKQSGGRRIKRAIYLDMNSIKFCSDELLQRFADISLLRDYLTAKQTEIESYNRANKVEGGSLINGRRQTNLGVFRAYVNAYLRQHPKVHQQMTFLVRHLAPTPYGLPVEIYVFANDQAWANYEAIQADIFDHLLAAVPQFDLRVFQYPSGHDTRPSQQAPHGYPQPGSAYSYHPH